MIAASLSLMLFPPGGASALCTHLLQADQPLPMCTSARTLLLAAFDMLATLIDCWSTNIPQCMYILPVQCEVYTSKDGG